MANLAAQQLRRRAIAYEQWRPYVDAEPIRQHITALARAGISLRRIGELSGVSRGALQALVYGKPAIGRPPNRKLRTAAAERILAIEATPDTQPDHGLVSDCTGTLRRIQALIALGWSMTRLAEHLGRDPSGISRLLTTRTVTVGTARNIRNLYPQLAWQPPPATTPGERASVEAARRYAHARHWPTPAAWDDIDTDPQPHHGAPGDLHVDQVAVARAIDGEPIPLNHAERKYAVDQLTRRGLSIRQIAARLRTHPRTVSRYRSNRPAA